MADSELQIYEAIKNDELVRLEVEKILSCVSAGQEESTRHLLDALLYLAAAAVNRQPYLTAPKPGEPDLFTPP